MPTLRQYIINMARTTGKYDGTFESFKQEFEDDIETRPSLLKQYGLFDIAVKGEDTLYIERIANRIALVQKTRQDTIMMDHYDSLMNILTRAYGFHLVRCPNCGVIHARRNDDEDYCLNELCSGHFRASEAPDLFM